MLGDDLANRPTRHPRSRVLRLRGLPYRAVEEDIHQFFAPVVVARIYVCRRNGAPFSPTSSTVHSSFILDVTGQSAGRTTGEAYAEFEDSAQAGEALRVKNRQHLGNRYIEYGWN